MLKGNTYCLSPGLLTRPSASSLVRKHGGKIVTYLSSQVTHLLASGDEIKKQSAIIQRATDSGIPIVTESRLTEIVSASGAQSPILASPSKNRSSRLSESGNTIIVNHSFQSSMQSLEESDGTAPTITLLLPDNGPNTGDFKVAVFGLGFAAGPGFKIRFGHVDAISYEFHSSTSLICTFPSMKTRPLPAADMICSASNDRGKTWGFPVTFRLYDTGYGEPAQPVDAKMAVLTSQLANVRRAVANIQQMEAELRSQLDNVAAGRPLTFSGDSSSQNGDNTSNGASNVDPSAQTLTQLPKTIRRSSREIRLFISSPFTDMQAERDLLVRSVIPKIRRMCVERDLSFSYVDLRWGVTSNQSESATALLRCLRELDSCNLFVGFYGERYGWSTAGERDSGKQQLLQRSIEIASKEFPWVTQYADRSMTELEMRMVLEKKYSGESIAAWFYLRDPYYLEEVAANEKHIYTSEGPVSKQRLDALKQELSKRVSPRGYNRPPALAEYVLDDLKEHVERAFPADQTLSPLERERFRHHTYSSSLTRVYLANEDAFNQLDKFVSSEIKRPFVVCGEPGIGKSALLANWVSRHVDAHPEDVVIPHFIGASPGSSNYGNILSRVLSEIRSAFEIDDPLDQLRTKSDEVTAQQISKEFVNSLKNLVTKHNTNRKRVIVVLDGINKLDDRDGAHDLVWLPSAFPKLVRVVISTAPHFILEVLKKRKSEMMEVKPLEEGQRKSFTRLYLNLMSKQLDEKLEFRISQAPQTSNPRYLKTLLDDVAAFGKFDQLGSKIDADLQASNTSLLYEIVLQRLEQDFDRNVVKNFMVLLSASRRGLMLSSELGVILSGKKFKITEDAWMSFFIAADESLLADCSGLILFANQDVRSAVERRYLRTQGDKIAAHRELAEFFSSSSDLTDRKVEELPYQLEKGGMFNELRDQLCDLNLFTKLYEDAHKFDLLRYWRELEQQNIDVVKAYDEVLSQGKFPPGAIIGDLLFRLGRFLYEMSKYGGSESVFKKAEHYYQKSSQTLPLARVQTSLAELYFTQGKIEETEVQLKRALSVYEREKGTDAEEISSICNKLGSLLTVQKKYSDALVVLQRALRIAESAFGVDAVPTADVIYNIACTLLCIGDADAIAKAEKHLLHALEIKELQLGPWDPEVSHVLLRLGELYLEQNQFGDAQECLERSLFIRETKLGPEHSRVAQTLKHMITCYEMQEKYDDALRVGFRALEITKKLFGAKHLHCSGILLRLGTVYLSKEDKANARKFILEALEMRKELFGATHRWTVEAQSALDSLLPKSAPSSPRGPPPPPPALERNLQRRVQQGSGMGGVLSELVAVRGKIGVESAVPTGLNIQDPNAPPPPPPPMPGYFSAPRAAPPQTRFVPKVAIGGGEAGNFEAEIQSYSGGLVKNEKVNDKANAWEAAKAMLGAKERKIQFKKKMK